MLKLQYFGHQMQTADTLEKTLTPGKTEGRRRRARQRMRWLDGIPNAITMNLHPSVTGNMDLWESWYVSTRRLCYAGCRGLWLLWGGVAQIASLLAELSQVNRGYIFLVILVIQGGGKKEINSILSKYLGATVLKHGWHGESKKSRIWPMQWL